MNSRTLIQSNISLVSRIKQDVYWHKVLNLCRISGDMIRVYDYKKLILDQKEWVEFVGIFENLEGKIDRIINRYGISVALTEEIDELDEMRVKIAALVSFANKKISN